MGRIVTAVFFGLGLLLASLPAHADRLPAPMAAFSASQTLSVDGTALSARLFHDKGLERRESRVDGLNNLLIIRPDRREALVIQPESKVGMKLPLTDPEVGVVATTLSLLSGTVEGTETLAGEKVTRYRVQDITPDGSGFDGRVWATKDGIYVKLEGRMAGEGAVTIAMTLTDIRRGAQDPTLFEPPADLSIMTLDPLQGRVPPAFQAEKETKTP
ncbi:hypothetical protein CHU95_18200 [Niveispirillum lacus]|uniref:DUF4412 domain-containing protein n=1 Tax=Niveispirillum lacus TaxID=1981099 RepID=A0A255YVM0_9PROT|nr:hypothetical protein [Niveispirillum lacus]OYQ32695.1 hypothetical protein CHU95_18200 [Niveispirillum lacus]